MEEYDCNLFFFFYKFLQIAIEIGEFPSVSNERNGRCFSNGATFFVDNEGIFSKRS